MGQAAAPIASQLKDINTTNAGGYPSQVTPVGGNSFFFTTTTGASGTELWKSDGTAAGTSLVKDIRPGGDSSNPSDLTNVGGTLFFVADDGTTGRELWKSDGTAAGTVEVKDIRSGVASGSLRSLLNANGTLFFTANDGTAGRELWKSDGTAAGTTMVKDIRSGGGSGANASYGLSNLVNVGGTVFFSANDGSTGSELWKSDGSTAGTVLVKDINPGGYSYYGTYYPYSSEVANLTAVGGKVFFSAEDGTTGSELWSSDGTAANTTLVKDIRTGGSGSLNSGYYSSSYFTNVGGTLFFAANDGVTGTELWKSDGTPAGTTQVKDIRAGSGASNPNNLTNVGGVLMFAANDGTTGNELWKSDGTGANTALVKNIAPGGSGSIAPGPQSKSFVEAGGKLFFVADDGTTGRELWKSDTTTAGTVEVKDIRAGAFSGLVGYYGASAPTNVNGNVVFAADDGVTGNELWKSDGSPAGTVLLKDTNTADLGSVYYPQSANLGSTVVFGANDATHGNELWKTDGTTAGTALLKDIDPTATASNPRSSDPGNFTAVGATIFFSARTAGSGSELWKTDGTAAGTVQVAEIRAGAASSGPSNLTNVGGTLFFTANDGSTGVELWRSDGTAAGTVRVKDINTASVVYYGNTYPDSSSPDNLVGVGNTLFFVANDGATGRELWKSDGTSAGTVEVKDIRTGSPNGVSGSLLNANGTLFFSANDGTTGTELWKSDGSAAGTVLVKDIDPSTYLSSGNTYPNSGYPANLVNVGSTVLFSARDQASGTELWKSDGTAAGTSQVKDIRSGTPSSAPYALAPLGSSIVFLANDGTTGRELWKSDGTAAGTALVKDVNPGAASGASGYAFENVAGTLYFPANDGTTGTELWRTDGTAANTALVTDIRPGSGSSSPRGLHNGNGVLFFAADDGVTGLEPWRAGAHATAPTATPTTTPTVTPTVTPPILLKPKLTAKAKPKRDKKKPFKFKVAGKLKLPVGVSKTAGCTGKVSVVGKVGKKVVFKKSTKITKACGYSAAGALSKKAGKHGTVKFVATFGGNANLTKASAKTSAKFG